MLVMYLIKMRKHRLLSPPQHFKEFYKVRFQEAIGVTLVNV